MNRLITTVTGVNEALKEVSSWVSCFNEFCGGGDYPKIRTQVSRHGLLAEDTEGSGEFCEARCINSNTAETGEQEVYEIYVLA